MNNKRKDNTKITGAEKKFITTAKYTWMDYKRS